MVWCDKDKGIPTERHQLVLLHGTAQGSGIYETIPLLHCIKTSSLFSHHPNLLRLFCSPWRIVDGASIATLRFSVCAHGLTLLMRFPCLFSSWFSMHRYPSVFCHSLDSSSSSHLPATCIQSVPPHAPRPTNRPRHSAVSGLPPQGSLKHLRANTLGPAPVAPDIHKHST